MSSRADELDDDLFDAVSLDGLTAQQRFQEASKVAERAIEALRETEAERDNLYDALERCLEFHKARVEHWDDVPGQRADVTKTLAQTWVDNISDVLEKVDQPDEVDS